MANQIQATVYQIDGNPLNNSIQIAFLTSNVYMREFQTDLIPEVNSAIVYYPNTSNQLQEQTFLVSETITALVSSANTGGTTQISTTVLEINQEPQIPSGLTFSFPVQGISIWPVANPVVGGVNSYLEFKNKKYYLLEDEAALVTAANTNPIGTIPTLDQVLTLGGNTTTNAINFNTGALTSLINVSNVNFFDVGTGSDSSYSYLNSKELLFQILASEYQTRLKPNNYELGLNITNYLPQNSGTLLNGNFVNSAGLKIDYTAQTFVLGNESGTNIGIDNIGNAIVLQTENLYMQGTNLLTTNNGTTSSQHLQVLINGTPYLIQLRGI